MNLENKNKKIMIFLILVIIIFTCFFSIKILIKIKNSIEIEKVLEQSIENTNWPKDVPIIQNKNINISTVGEKYWEIKIKEYVSYEDFKTYLIELYNNGFEPIKEMGSDNPKRLSTNAPTEKGFVLIWCAKSEEYNVEAYWFNTDFENAEIQGMDNYCVNILLSSNSSMDSDINSENSKGDNFSSGDYISGASLNVDVISGDNIVTSGD